MTSRSDTHDVQGYCPVGCGRTLFLDSGGGITCSYLHCPNPTAVADILLDSETEHVVRLKETTFDVQHPLRERLNGDLFQCDIHQRIAALDGPPRAPGRYRVTDNWTWHRLTDSARTGEQP